MGCCAVCCAVQWGAVLCAVQWGAVLCGQPALNDVRRDRASQLEAFFGGEPVLRGEDYP
jgi:hypothetical protein